MSDTFKVEPCWQRYRSALSSNTRWLNESLELFLLRKEQKIEAEVRRVCWRDCIHDAGASSLVIRNTYVLDNGFYIFSFQPPRLWTILLTNIFRAHRMQQSSSRCSPGPSLYETMLASAPSDYLTNLEGASYELPPKYPVYYFFYGTLKDPAMLEWILDLPEEEEPELRPAQIIGYALGKWGDYPALVDSEQEQVVSGSSYIVQSEDQAQKLAHYETKAYKVIPCRIRFTT